MSTYRPFATPYCRSCMARNFSHSHGAIITCCQEGDITVLFKKFYRPKVLAKRTLIADKMIGRFRRKMSRTKSVPEVPVKILLKEDEELRRTMTLSPSDEELIARLDVKHDTVANTVVDEQPVADHNLSPVEQRLKRTIFNDVDAGMLSMPTEMLLVLKRYLRPSSEVALRHTCSRFFYLYSLPSFYLSGEEKFDFVCMTERDQDPTQLDRLVCGLCRELHPKTAFPSAEIVQLPLQRDCRQVWLCAHRMLGYSRTVRSLKAGVEAPFRAEYLDPCNRCREVVRNRSVADRPEKGTSTMDLESPKSESLLISKIAIMQRPAPLYSKKVGSGSGLYKEVFTAKEVSDALQAIDFRLCPHIKLGDPFILSKFCRSCTNTQRLPPGVKGPPCISNWNRDERAKTAVAKCKGSCFDRSCRTKFMFQTRESLQPDASGRIQVWLFIVVYRWLGPLLTAGSDRQWRDHTINHEERCDMRKRWERWEKSNKGMQPMPNWSISLLHPEDCGLR